MYGLVKGFGISGGPWNESVEFFADFVNVIMALGSGEGFWADEATGGLLEPTLVDHAKLV